MKTLKNLLYVSIAAISILACKQKTGDTTEKKFAADSLVLDSNQLTYAAAKAYVHNYEKHAGVVDSTVNGADLNERRVKKMPDTRAIWFDIHRLESIVERIKAEHGDGIRFYLATYDSTYVKAPEHGHKPPRQYWGYNTLVMVSTKDSLGTYHHDYYNNIGTNDNPKKRHGIIITVDPENRGEICPPPHNCNQIGATLINP